MTSTLAQGAVQSGATVERLHLAAAGANTSVSERSPVTHLPTKEEDLMELEICTDCYTFLACGESVGAVADRIRERWGPDIYRLTVDGEHLGISWSPCDACGTALGGDRFAADFSVRDRAR